MKIKMSLFLVLVMAFLAIAVSGQEKPDTNTSKTKASDSGLSKADAKRALESMKNKTKLNHNTSRASKNRGFDDSEVEVGEVIWEGGKFVIKLRDSSPVRVKNRVKSQQTNESNEVNKEQILKILNELFPKGGGGVVTGSIIIAGKITIHGIGCCPKIRITGRDGLIDKSNTTGSGNTANGYQALSLVSPPSDGEVESEAASEISKRSCVGNGGRFYQYSNGTNYCVDATRIAQSKIQSMEGFDIIQQSDKKVCWANGGVLTTNPAGSFCYRDLSVTGSNKVIRKPPPRPRPNPQTGKPANQ